MDPREFELAQIAAWLQIARDTGVSAGIDPFDVLNDLALRWNRILTSSAVMEPETRQALLDARRTGALPELVVTAHLVGMAEYSDDAIARELFRWLERSAELRGAGGTIGELTDPGDLGARGILQLVQESPELLPLPPKRGAYVRRGQWRGVPADPKGRQVDVAVSGRIPRPDDPRFQAEVRAIDAALRKLRGRRLAAERQARAREKQRAAGVSVVEHPTGDPKRRGTVTAGIRRRKRRKRRK